LIAIATAEKMTSIYKSTEALHVGRPNIGNRETFLGMVEDILNRKWLSNNGCYVQKFETRVAEYLGVRHCVAMCNATIGLEITVRALDLKGEVIVPSFTFAATAHCLLWQSIQPVFCDIDSCTHNIDPVQVESLISPRTTAILATHLWGRGCDVQALKNIADRHGLKLIFDAAHAFGCSHGGRMIGGFGSAEVFSFHATKFVNSLEGGIVATNDDELMVKLRRMKNFGFTGYDQTGSVGTNGKMHEISAAMGLTNLKSLEEFVAINRAHHELYREGLVGLRGITVMPYDQTERCNYQYVVVEVDATEAGIDRDELMNCLHAQGIIARRYFYPGCHRMEPYRTLYPRAGERLPETEKMTERVIVLPTGQSVRPEDVVGICQIIENAIASAH